MSIRYTCTGGLALTVVLASAAQVEAGSIDLGAASDFSVFSFGGKVSLTNPQSGIDGNVALGAGAKQEFSDGYITGDLIVDPLADNGKSNNVQIGGSTMTSNLLGAMLDAVSASDHAASLTPSQVFGKVKDPLTINGTGGMNVIQVDKIDFSGDGDTLTFVGSANDFFVVNVMDEVKLSHKNSAILVDGVSEANVLFNFLGSGDVLRTSGDASIAGTYLSPFGSFTLSPGRLVGSLLAAGDIKLTSGATIESPAVVVPLPAPVFLGAAGLLMVGMRRRLQGARVD